MQASLLPHPYLLPITGDSELHTTRLFKPADPDDWIDRKHTLTKDHWVWAILEGLNLIDLPFLAHVAIAFVPGANGLETPKRIWAQITTIPDTKTPDGDPVLVSDGQLKVVGLWSTSDGTDGTHAPFHFLDLENQIGHNKRKPPEFWANFFMECLRDARRKAEAREDIFWDSATESILLFVPAE